MCFKDNEPPDTAVIQELLNLLFVYRSFLEDSGELPSQSFMEPILLAAFLTCPSHPFCIATDRPAAYTKLLSPFDEEVDKTPVIRSVMLKLLLKYR